MLNIEIKTIPQKEQRYETVGDYWNEGEKDFFRISDCGNRKYEAMLAIHELIEKFLCESDGVTNKQIDDFDFNYKGDGEPGDDKDAPYRKQHLFATGVEKLLCSYFGIDWKTYDSFLENIE